MRLPFLIPTSHPELLGHYLMWFSWLLISNCSDLFCTLSTWQEAQLSHFGASFWLLDPFCVSWMFKYKLNVSQILKDRRLIIQMKASNQFTSDSASSSPPVISDTFCFFCSAIGEDTPISAVNGSKYSGIQGTIIQNFELCPFHLPNYKSVKVSPRKMFRKWHDRFYSSNTIENNLKICFIPTRKEDLSQQHGSD